MLLLLCLFLIFMFRTAGSSGLWRSHLVLLTSASVEEQDVLEELAALGISGTVSISSSFIDLYPSFFPLKTNFSKESVCSYFSDKDVSLSLYYIPRIFESTLMHAKKHDQLSFDFTLDTEYRLPNIGFILCVLISVFLAAASKNKLFFCLLCLPLLLFAFSFPSLSILPLLLCLLYISYYVQQARGRAHKARAWLSHKMILLLCSCILFSLFFIPFRALVLFPVLLFSLCAVFFLAATLFNFFEQKKRFVPVLIFSAVYKKRASKKAVFFFIPAAVSILAGLFCIFFYTNNVSIRPGGTIMIPGPEQTSSRYSFGFTDYESSLRKETVLPSLAQYVTDCWNSSVFPYSKISASAALLSIPHQSSAGITRFKKEGQSIKSYTETVFVFDNTFIDSILEGIDNSSTTGIQQVLLGQLTFSPIVYKPIHTTAEFRKWLLLLSVSCIFFLVLTGISYKDLFGKEHA